MKLLSGFRGIALTNCFSSIFHFGQISKFKNGIIPRKRIESKFLVDLHIYTLCPSFLQSFTKFCWMASEELRWQEKQDWRTDLLTDGSKTLYPPQLVAWGIIIAKESVCQRRGQDWLNGRHTLHTPPTPQKLERLLWKESHNVPPSYICQIGCEFLKTAASRIT